MTQLVVGNFNTTLHPINRFSEQNLNRKSSGLIGITQQMDLQISTKYPTQTPKNTFYSAAHNFPNRDYILHVCLCTYVCVV